MKVTETKIPGVLIIDTDVFGDHRGWFTETYEKPKYEKIGVDVAESTLCTIKISQLH